MAKKGTGEVSGMHCVSTIIKEPDMYVHLFVLSEAVEALIKEDDQTVQQLHLVLQLLAEIWS